MIDFKDLLTIISLVIAFLSVVFSIIHSQKVLYVNAITNARLKFTESLRTQVAEFCGLKLYIATTKLPASENNIVIENFLKKGFLIKLHLSRKNSIDIRIIELVDSISNFSNDKKIDDIEKELSDLVNYVQDVFDLEWAGIKREAFTGRLSIKRKESLIEKHLYQ